MKAIIVVHGGAGVIPDSRVQAKLQGVKSSLLAAVRSLRKCKNAKTAVCTAVAIMEDDPVMNAGYGSVLNEDGQVEMDAAVMEGQNLGLGGVVCVGRVKNPIWLAEKVLEHSPHCLLAGEGSERFAASQGMPLVPNESLISPDAKKAWELFKMNRDNYDFLSTQEGTISNELGGVLSSHDTVGAVAMDFQGNLAAATSTGGLNGKAKGRIGDSPIAGAGLFADNQLAAVSTTGQGEALYRGLVALRIAEKLAHSEATDDGSSVVRHCMDVMSARLGGGDGGAIAIDSKGRIAIGWNSLRMSWAYAIIEDSSDDIQSTAVEVHSGCNTNEHFIERLTLD